MGWLHAIPTGSKVSRQDKQKEIHLPHIDVGGYLIEYWQDIGMAQYTGMGEAPLSHSEITAWANVMGIVLNPFEHKTIRRLSENYLASKSKATEENCPQPYIDARITDAEKVSSDIDRVFRQYNADRKKDGRRS